MSVYMLKHVGMNCRLREAQLTTYWIGKIFGIFPDSIVLVASDETIEVPDENGFFTLESYLDYEVQDESININAARKDSQIITN